MGDDDARIAAEENFLSIACYCQDLEVGTIIELREEGLKIRKMTE